MLADKDAYKISVLLHLATYYETKGGEESINAAISSYQQALVYEPNNEQILAKLQSLKEAAKEP